MFTMSHSGSSYKTSPHIGNSCVGGRTGNSRGHSANKDTKLVSNDSSRPDTSVRDRVLKQVGLTSTTFIGPAGPPRKSTKKKVKKVKKVKSNIEDTLSEFYKELEKIDTPDGANYNPGKQHTGRVRPSKPPKTSTSRETPDVGEEKVEYAGRHAGTDGYQRNSGQKQPSWPHWHQNEPYYPRRPGPAAPTQNQWHHPQTLNRPPDPRFHRPPFHRPPPPSAFPNPRNPPPHVNQNWSSSGTTNQHQEESHFPTFSSFPPPNVCSPPSQGFYGDSPHHFDKDERIRSYDVRSDNVKVGSSGDRKEESCQFGQNYDRSQRYDSKNESWEHQRRPPANTNPSSSVLILMRGLPGSGKSTKARELLSTGPSGLILSTDDYFAHRDGYRYDAGLLGAAHEWNQNRAKDAIRDGRSPIIIDNTNGQAWEMKPYVQMALERGYKVDFCEPETSWKFDPYELEKRNKHSVPQEKIAQMKDRFVFPISVDIVMRSQEPLHVNQRRQPEQPQTMRGNPDFH